ncbi:MAG: DUF935 family protein [Burkholderiales bacterium]|nr:DUF935 family protein [Burkholderiales bacterium]
MAKKPQTTPDNSPQSKPVLGPLASAQSFLSAINGFMNYSLWSSEADAVLVKAGINRTSLRQLEGDGEISAALETRREAVISTPWRLEPEQGANADNVAFIQSAIAPHVEAMQRGFFDAVPYGYAVIEALPENTADGIKIASVIVHDFANFTPLIDGGLMLRQNAQRVDQSPWAWQLFHVVRNPTARNPMGEPLLSRLYWPWFYRANGWQFWAKSLERCGTPFLVGKTVGDCQNMADALVSASQNAVISIPDSDDVSALKLDANPALFTDFESALVRSIQKVVLGQTLTTGTDGSGSRALGQVHDSVRQDKKQADIRLISTGIQKVIDNLWLLNEFAGTAPRFAMQDNAGLERDRAERDKVLMDAGLIAGVTRAYMEDRYDFKSDDFVMPQEVAPQPGQQQASMSRYRFAGAGDRQFTPGQQALEDLIAATEQLDTGALDAMRRAVFAATSKEDLELRLKAALDPMSESEFASNLARAQFAATVLGYINADKGIN